MGCGSSKNGGESGPSIRDTQQKEDKRIERVGYPRLHPGGVIEIKSCNFGELDNLLVPLVQVHNKLATVHNGVYCGSLGVRCAAGEAQLKIALIGETKREVLAQGWRDDSIDYGGRATCKGEEICHYAGVRATLCNGKGEALADAERSALFAKYKGLEALVGRLGECEMAINSIGATWKALEAKGAFSLGIQPYGGVDELHVYRQPFHIASDKPLGVGVFLALSKESFTGSVYHKEPPNNVKRAVNAFNKAAFSIRLKLASPKPLKQIVDQVFAKYGHLFFHQPEIQCDDIDAEAFQASFIKASNSAVPSMACNP